MFPTTLPISLSGGRTHVESHPLQILWITVAPPSSVTICISWTLAAYELFRPCLLGHSCSPASLLADYRISPWRFFLSTGSHNYSTTRLRPIPWLWITQCSHYVTILDLDDSIWLHAAPQPSISLARLELPGFFLEGFPQSNLH